MAKKKSTSKNKNWIKGAIKRPGALTRKAKRAGKSVAEFRDDVLSNPDEYSELTRKQANFAKTLASFQGGGPFRDDAANKALRNAGLTLGASTLTRGVISPLVQNRRADKAAYNQYMGIMDRAYQNSGYDSYADYCLTGDCPQNPFQGNPPTFRDWRNHDYFGAGETNARPTYRFVNDFKEKPLEGTMGPAIKAGARDALVSGALTYGANKLLDNTRFGRNLQRNFNVNVGFRRYQPGGAVGNPYAMPTSAATSGYTSTMSGMAGAHQAQMQLAQIQQEAMAEQQRRERVEQEREAAEKQAIRKEVQTTGAALTPEVGKAIATGVNTASIAKGTADAAQIAKASKDTGQLLTNLGNYGSAAKQGATGAQVAGQGIKAGLQSMGPGPIAAAASLTGKGIERLSDDDDDTRTTFGEGFGRGLSGAGTGVGLAAMAGLGPLGLVLAGGAGLTTALINQARQRKAAAKEEAKQQEQDAQIAASEQEAFLNSMTRTGTDMGYNVGSSMTNSYLPGQQQFVGEAGGAKNMNINEKYLAGSKDRGRRAELIREIASIYEKGEPYPDRLESLMKERDKLKSGGMADLDAAEKEVYKRGLAAYMSSGNRPKVSQHAWARARVNSPFGKREAAKIRKEGTGEKKEEKQGGGLWANIHAKRARGERMRKKGEAGAPTEEQMNRAKAESGGYMRPLPGGAVEFVGPKHSKGGIKLDANTEVEGGETMDKVTMKNGGPQDYIFSDFLKLGGKTFAQRHKEMLNGGATQKQIQNLAKMQEEVARREGRDENGKRDPNMVMQEGGAYNPWAFGSGEDWARQARPGDNIDMEGYIGGRDYGDIGGTIFSDYYSSGPGGSDPQREMFAEDREKWYDEVYTPRVEKYFEDNPDEAYDMLQKMVEGDDPNADNFRRKLLDKDGNMKPKEEALKIAKGLATDKKLGSFHMYLPDVMEEIPTIPGNVPNELPPKELQPTEPTVPEPEQPGIKLRKDVLMPWQLIGPFAELSTKYPQPDKIAAQPTGRIKLPRVNYNAERASLSGSTNAANKFIQNQAAGPGAISSMMATNEKQRAGNLELANAEARTNKELAAQEELANLQASQFDSSQGMRASTFNAQAQNLRDQNEYEKRMLAFNQLGTNLAQYGKDLRSYKAEERAAEAFQIDNEYTRQKYLEELRRQSKRKKSEYYGMNDNQLKEAAAKMVQGTPTWNAQNQARLAATTTAADMQKPAEETKRRGGYLSKLGRVKRRRK